MISLSLLSDGPLFGLPLPELWFGLVFFILAMFLFLDGFDFGVGLLFATRDDEHEREQLLAAIGPFWDGNEVWLVVFGGALFAAFPSIYAALFSRHYLLMFAILGALIIRGLAPEMYEQREDESWKRVWGVLFVAGSVAAPFFLGVFTAHWMLGETALFTVRGVLVALALVALTVVSGAAFLSLKTRGDLRREMARYGVRAVFVYLGLVVVALGYIFATRMDLRGELLSPVTLALVAVTVVAAAVVVVGLRSERYYLAFGAVAAMVFDLVVIVASILFPLVDPVTGLTIRDAIVSTIPLNLMTILTAILLPLVLSYFAVLYSSFSGPVEAGETY